eukprot:gene46751-63333_t
MTNRVITHQTKDLALYSKQCNLDHFALNISENTVPYLGDEVVAFGYGSTAKVWRGYVSDIVKFGNDSLATHFSLLGKITTGEYLIQSAQHPGMSGSVIANGYGYVGMAHAVQQDELNTTAFAAVISA